VTSDAAGPDACEGAAIDAQIDVDVPIQAEGGAGPGGISGSDGGALDSGFWEVLAEQREM